MADRRRRVDTGKYLVTNVNLASPSVCDDPLISGYTDYLRFLHNNQGLKNEKDPKNYPTFQI